MTPRLRHALLLAAALLGGCKLYDSGKARLRIEIAGSNHVSGFLNLSIVAPSTVGGAFLTVDGVPVKNPPTYPANAAISLDASRYAYGAHQLVAMVADRPDIEPSDPVEFVVEGALTATWSPAPQTLTFVHGQVFRVRFWRALSAASRQAVVQATAITDALGGLVPSSVVDLGDGENFEVTVPDADLRSRLTASLPTVTATTGLGATPDVATWFNTPLVVTLTSDVAGPRVTAADGKVTFTVTLSGRTTQPVHIDNYGPQSYYWDLAGPPYTFVWDTTGAPEGNYAPVARAQRYDATGPTYGSGASFWVARTPAVAPACEPYSRYSADLLHLGPHEIVTCTLTRPLDAPSLSAFTLLDGNGLAVPMTVQTATGLPDRVYQLARTSGAGLPGPGTLVLRNARDSAGYAVPDTTLPLAWPAWLPLLGPASSGMSSTSPAALACGGSVDTNVAAVAWVWPGIAGEVYVGTATFSASQHNTGSLGLWWSTSNHPDTTALASDAPALAFASGFDYYAGPVQWAARAVGTASSEIHPSRGTIDGVTAAQGRPVGATDPVTGNMLLAFVDGGAVVVERLALGTGAPAWQREGGLPVSGGTPAEVTLAVDAAGKAAVAWAEGGAVVVKKMGASDWAAVGAPITGAAGVTLSAPSIGVMPSGQPVVAYQASAGSLSTVLVSRWNGSAWAQVGGALNADAARSAYAPALTVDSTGRLFAALADDDAGGRVVRVRHFDGSAWVLTGGVPPDAACTTACVPALAVCPGDRPLVTRVEPLQPVVVHLLNTW